MELRYYQSEAIQALYDYFEAHSGHPVIALPTGTGKSLVIAAFIRDAILQWPQTRIVMLTHVKELIEQNYLELLKAWPTAPVGVYSSGLKRRERRKITYAGIASVYREPEAFGHIDLVVIDECHLVSPKDDTMYKAFLDGLAKANPALRVIGLSATPYRLGQGHLTEEGGLFTDIRYDCTTLAAFNRLVGEGYICPLVPRKTEQEIDTSQVNMRLGEFNLTQLAAAADHASLTRSAVREMVRLGMDRKHWLVFCSGITHAEHVTDALLSEGVSAVCVHSQMDASDRDKHIRGFKAGKYQAIVNNNVLTTGFNMPGIDLIGMLRPTTSPGLWVQMLGRGTRPAPGKDNCLVLDFAGNTRRLGPINDPVPPRKKGQGGGEAPVKLCEACGTYNHASLRHCSSCGAEFPIRPKIVEHAGTDVLIRSSEPVVETFDVDTVEYLRHQNPGGTPSVKVRYTCGVRDFLEFVCIEHEGFAGKKARDWWRDRSGQNEVPDSVDNALALTKALRIPRAIRVWLNTKYPRILNAFYPGEEAVQQEFTEVLIFSLE